MYCGNCGFEFKGKICPQCGFNSKRKSKNIFIFFIMIITVLVVGVVGGKYFYNKDSNKNGDKIIEYLKKNKYSEAEKYYRVDCKCSAKVANSISADIVKLYDEIISDYNGGKTSSEEIDIFVKLVKEMGISNSKEYKDFKNDYNLLKKSKENYNYAIDNINSDNYMAAVEFLVQVNKIDNNYDDAKNKIKECVENLINSYDDLGEALEELDNLKFYLEDDDYLEIKNSITDSLLSSIDNKVTQYLNDDKYNDAVEYLNNIVDNNSYDIDGLNDRLDGLEDEYIEIVKNKASKYAESGEYGKAASAVELAISQLPEENKELNSLYEDYKSYLGVYIDELETLKNEKKVYINDELEDNLGNYYDHSWRTWKETQYYLSGKYKTFSGIIALIYSDKNTSYKYYYEIYGDENLLYTSPEIGAGSMTENFNISVENVNVLKIVGHYVDYDDYDDRGRTVDNSGAMSYCGIAIYDGLLSRN